MQENWHAKRGEFHRTRFQTLAQAALVQAEQAENDDCFWLLAPSSYLCKTGKTVWGMDLCRLPGETIAESALRPVSFALVTHSHSDHFDKALLAALAKHGASAALPAFFPAEQVENIGFPPEKLHLVSQGEAFTMENVAFSVFDSLHLRPGTQTGVPEIGFRAETGGKSLLFPGDVRDYAPAKLHPLQGKADTVFAHVWLGDGGGDKTPDFALLEQFATFYAAFAPKKIFLTHLYRADRNLSEMWTYTHAGLAMDALSALLPETEIVIPQLGRKYGLF